MVTKKKNRNTTKRGDDGSKSVAILTKVEDEIKIIEIKKKCLNIPIKIYKVVKQISFTLCMSLEKIFLILKNNNTNISLFYEANFNITDFYNCNTVVKIAENIIIKKEKENIILILNGKKYCFAQQKL
jgi:hypothetical protein